jgi:hypothetical protein
VCAGSNVDSGYGYGHLAQAESNCGSPGMTSAIWWPDLRTNQTSTMIAIMVRF